MFIGRVGYLDIVLAVAALAFIAWVAVLWWRGPMQVRPLFDRRDVRIGLAALIVVFGIVVALQGGSVGWGLAAIFMAGLIAFVWLYED